MGNRVGNFLRPDNFNDRVIVDASCTDVNASSEKNDKLTDNEKNVLVAASNSNGAFATDTADCDRDQPDSAGEDGSVYVQVTILSKKVDIREDGTILLSSLSESLILNYCELSDCHYHCDYSTQYYMKHSIGGREHQLGICERGPFKQISPRTPSECRKIDFTDIHTDHCTISNKSNKLYLKARAESNSKVKVVKKAKGYSYFCVCILHPHKRTTAGAILCYIFLAEDKSLAFKFNQDSREVMIDKFNASSKNSFQFELSLAGEFSKVNFAETC